MVDTFIFFLDDDTPPKWKISMWGEMQDPLRWGEGSNFKISAQFLRLSKISRTCVIALPLSFSRKGVDGQEIRDTKSPSGILDGTVLRCAARKG